MNRPHLTAAMLVFGITGLGLGSLELLAPRMEALHIRSLAPTFMQQKLQGLALQRAAAHTKDIVIMYGSSELNQPVDTVVGDFFAAEPTGFAVMPVGRGGTTPVIMSQHIAPLLKDLRGKKVVVSISPGWFFRTQAQDSYASNFSVLHGMSIIFGGLDMPLRRKMALRMADYPEALNRNSLLKRGVEALVSDSPWNRFVFALMEPMGKFCTALFRAEDHFNTLLEMASVKGPAVDNSIVDWPQRLAEADKDDVIFQPRPASTGRLSPLQLEGLASLEANKVWDDLEVVLDLLNAAQAKPLILSIPLDGPHCDDHARPREVRSAYYTRLKDTSARHRIPVFTFEEHEYDSDFLVNHTSHLTHRAWLYFNKTIDDFYHDRLPASKN